MNNNNSPLPPLFQGEYEMNKNNDLVLQGLYPDGTKKLDTHRRGFTTQ